MTGTRSWSASLGACWVLALGLGCGGAEPETKTAGDLANAPSDAESPTASAATASSSTPTADEPKGLPTTCESKGKACVPPAKFVKRLCSGFHPDVALVFFKSGSPFTRAYLKLNTEAWNASGGASSNDKLVFDEEVLVVQAREASTEGIQVSGSTGGSFDVLRWDGTCATLSGEEITFSSPPKAKNAKITWQDLADTTQEALRGDAKIAKLNDERRKECKGATMGEVSKKCVTLTEKLSEAIVGFVRGGGEVPPPAKLP